MRKRGFKSSFKPRYNFIVNQSIRSCEVRLIDDAGENHGLIDFRDALQMARDKGLDLVQISKPNGKESPVCRIVELGKYKYEFDKKEKAEKKKQRENSIKIKEIKFRPSTDQHDLETKAKHAVEFIEEGNKVKITIIFRGRELTHKEVAMETLGSFLEMVEIARFESDPKMTGRNMSVILCRK